MFIQQGGSFNIVTNKRGISRIELINQEGAGDLLLFCACYLANLNTARGDLLLDEIVSLSQRLAQIEKKEKSNFRKIKQDILTTITNDLMKKTIDWFMDKMGILTGTYEDYQSKRNLIYNLHLYPSNISPSQDIMYLSDLLPNDYSKLVKIKQILMNNYNKRDKVNLELEVSKGSISSSSIRTSGTHQHVIDNYLIQISDIERAIRENPPRFDSPPAEKLSIAAIPFSPYQETMQPVEVIQSMPPAYPQEGSPVYSVIPVTSAMLSAYSPAYVEVYTPTPSISSGYPPAYAEPYIPPAYAEPYIPPAYSPAYIPPAYSEPYIPPAYAEPYAPPAYAEPYIPPASAPAYTPQVMPSATAPAYPPQGMPPQQY